MLLPQMLSHFIRAAIPLPVTLGASRDRTEVSPLGIDVHAVLVTDTFVIALERLGAWGVGAWNPGRCWRWWKIES
jgi:hypothetical protein